MHFEYVIRTRYSETGQDGIIHHSFFIVYLEVARIEFFNTIGCNINEIEKAGMFCPVVDISVRYLRPLRSMEDITIQVKFGAVSKVKFQLDYEIFRKNERVAIGTSTHCFLNSAFKPIPILKDFIPQNR